MDETLIKGLAYEHLSAEFDHTFSDHRGGVDLTYITGEQVVSRLNEVLGYDGWSFRILSSSVVEDEVLVLGELLVWDEQTGAQPSVRQQYGSQKIKRKRDSQIILDIGFDYKGAATDALKKCASLIGVGLYLSKKEERTAASRGPSQQWDTDGNVVSGKPPPGPASGVAITCETCGEEMRDTTRTDGSVWLATEKAEYSRKRYQGRVLCYSCSRNAG